MDNGGTESDDSSRNPTLGCIASGRRRAVLGYLLERDAPATAQALATTLAATGQGKPITDVTAADVWAVRTELAHVDLPILADAGLVTRTDGTVATTSHPALDDPRFRRLLAVDADGFDAALSALARERRRIVLTVLRDAGSPVSRSELAREVLGREPGTSDPDPGAIERIAASLHHAQLPQLAEDDLVEYDRETGRVAYADHPALETAFGIIYEPDERLVEKFDGFLDGLESSYRQAGQDTGGRFDWPHFWGDPHHG